MEWMIAIVEDDPNEAEILQNHFRRYSAGDEQFQIQWFRCGNDFLSNYQPIYDIVMMDIDMPGLNGMETAAALRTLDPTVVLLFVTNLARYAIQGYAVDASDFLLKPVSFNHFSLAIRRALLRCRYNHHADLLINIPSGIYRISASRIKYVEVINHTLSFHTTEGVLNATGNLKDLEAQLDSTQFVRCNRCYLVNLAFVRAVQGYTLLLDTDKLQISRPKRAAVLEALNRYLGGGV